MQIRLIMLIIIWLKWLPCGCCSEFVQQAPLSHKHQKIFIPGWTTTFTALIGHMNKTEAIRVSYSTTTSYHTALLATTVNSEDGREAISREKDFTWYGWSDMVWLQRRQYWMYFITPIQYNELTQKVWSRTQNLGITLICQLLGHNSQFHSHWFC